MSTDLILCVDDIQRSSNELAFSWFHLYNRPAVSADCTPVTYWSFRTDSLLICDPSFWWPEMDSIQYLVAYDTYVMVDHCSARHHNAYSTFLIISLLCGFGGANFASSMANISLFYPKTQQGKALGLNGGLGNLGVSVMQMLVPIVISVNIFGPFGLGQGNPDASIWLSNAPLIWMPVILILSIAAWHFMNDIAAPKASFKEQWVVLKQKHLWIMSVLYLAAFGSFIGFSAGFAMLAKTQFPDIEIMKYAFIGPLFGALMRPVGGVLSDKLGGVKVTFVSFCLMATLVAVLFSTLPSDAGHGNFTYFLAVFMALFSCAGVGSGSTFQMIAVLFRGMMIKRNLQRYDSEAQALKKSANDTATALGFISAIGAIGGFFIPNAFGLSIALSGTPINAMKAFLVFYVICGLITWFVYGKELNK
ncbi:MFS transporter [Aeromonas veronii]|uniref:MFS transporter n=1 Tax=Aeromonas veronii TaxID=654 RepID=UPI003F7A640F